MLVRRDSAERTALARLFPASYPNLAFVLAALAGTLPGRVWSTADDAACLVATEAPFCFAAGALTPALLREIGETLSGRPSTRLIVPRERRLEQGALGPDWRAEQRAQYRGLAAPIAPIAAPPGYRLVRLDAGLYARSLWPEAVHAIYGDPDEYARHHYGYGLRHGGRIVAEAHGVVGGDLVEIGLFTDPEHRGRGLARALAGALFGHGAALGQTPTLTCAADRVESLRVAQRFLVPHAPYDTWTRKGLVV